MAEENGWLSIIVGRTHTHWAWFNAYELSEAWATELLADGHLTAESVFGLPVKMLPDQVREFLQKKSSEEVDGYAPLVYIASDDTAQSEMWALRLPGAKTITLADLRLKGSHRSLEIHRALCLRAAASKWGWPVLVIDAGTTITYSACNELGEVTGGAMLPGVVPILQAMTSQGVRSAEELPDALPPRWASNTDDPVQSGVIHTVLAGMAGYTSDFSKQHDEGKVVFTGDDGRVLWQWFRDHFKQLGNRCMQHPYLAHLGVRWKYIQDTCSQAPDGGPGYIGHAVSKRFGNKFFRGVVKEYLPSLDEDAERGSAYWGLEYHDGDVEEVDSEELRELLENAKQQHKDKRSRSATDQTDDDSRSKRHAVHEVSIVDDDSA